MALGQRQLDTAHMQANPETDDDKRYDGTSSDDDPFPNYDVSTLEARKRLVAAPAISKKPPPAAPPTNSFEATAQLAVFELYPAEAADLRLLLEAGAAPNVAPGPRDLSPLRNVILCARSCSVVEMRQLLLQYGAVESTDDRKRWEIRRRAEANEAAWMYNRHKDDRV